MVWFALTFVDAHRVRRPRRSSTTAGSRSRPARRRRPTPPRSAARCSCPRTSATRRSRPRRRSRARTASPTASNGVTITTAAGRLPNQLKVTIAINTKNPWGAIVNYNSTTIVRSAVAEYQLPQNLGSPQNSYGNDPESAAAQPQFWGNVFGPSSNKDKGDAIQSAGPTANATLCNADNCPSARATRTTTPTATSTASTCRPGRPGR